MTGGGGVVVRTVLDTGAGKAGAADQGLRRRLVDVPCRRAVRGHRRAGR